jgi:hypothetical protein
MRTFDANLIWPAIKLYLGTEEQEDPIAWISDPNNIVLVNEDGDVALFEPRVKGQYSGHYFFKNRGRAAIKAGKAFLDELFNTCYNIGAVTGFCPIDNKPARWMSRQIGFTSYGPVDLHELHFELFIITKEEFNK